MWNLGSLAHYPTCKMITFQASIFSTRSLGRFWSGPTILVFFIWSPMMKFDICGATKQKQWLGVFLNIWIFPIFSLYTYWTMCAVNFKSFRLKNDFGISNSSLCCPKYNFWDNPILKFPVTFLDRYNKCDRSEQKQACGCMKSTAEVCTWYRLGWSSQYDFLGNSTVMTS